MLTDEQHNALYDVLRDYKVHAGNGAYYTQRIAILEALLASSAAMPIAPAEPHAIPSTNDARDAALFEDDDERDEFVRAVQDFEDDGETAVDYNLLMKWAASGLLECEHFTVTSAGTKAFDAALQSHSEGDQR